MRALSPHYSETTYCIKGIPWLKGYKKSLGNPFPGRQGLSECSVTLTTTRWEANRIRAIHSETAVTMRDRAS